MRRRQFLHRFARLALAGCGTVCAPAWMGLRSAAADSFEIGLKAQGLIAAKQYGDAVKLLKQALAEDPGNEWLRGLVARAYFNSGKYYEESGDMESAGAMYYQAALASREVLKINPDATESKMMLEIIKQKPLKAPPVQKERPLSPLEKKAQQEEKEMLRKLRDSGGGLDYQVQRIVLDPGHGGFDPGAVGPSGLQEKDVTLALARGLYGKLRARGGFELYLTRDEDYYVPLGERTATANQRRADLFVSFHINAAENRKARGSETYYCSEKASSGEAERLAAFENSVIKYDEKAPAPPGFLDIEAILFRFERKLYWDDSKQFAHLFQGRFGADLPMRDRGVQFANFYVLRRAKMPALLLETGFISNPEEEQLLKQERFLEQILNAAYTAVVGLSNA